jgi:hypothetical protein
MPFEALSGPPGPWRGPGGPLFVSRERGLQGVVFLKTGPRVAWHGAGPALGDRPWGPSGAKGPKAGLDPGGKPPGPMAPEGMALNPWGPGGCKVPSFQARPGPANPSCQAQPKPSFQARPGMLFPAGPGPSQARGPTRPNPAQPGPGPPITAHPRQAGAPGPGGSSPKPKALGGRGPRVPFRPGDARKPFPKKCAGNIAPGCPKGAGQGLAAKGSAKGAGKGRR